MRRTLFLLLPAIAALGGCATTFAPKSLGEQESGYTYVPIDPFAVETVPGTSCLDSSHEKAKTYGTLLQSLPDNAVRMLIERFNASGSVTYGPSKLGVKGESYRVTVDYINADTINVRVWIRKGMERREGGYKEVSLLSVPDDRLFVPGSEVYTITREDPGAGSGSVEFNIPVYIGIGPQFEACISDG